MGGRGRGRGRGRGKGQQQGEGAPGAAGLQEAFPSLSLGPQQGQPGPQQSGGNARGRGRGSAAQSQPGPASQEAPPQQAGRGRGQNIQMQAAPQMQQQMMANPQPPAPREAASAPVPQKVAGGPGPAGDGVGLQGYNAMFPSKKGPGTQGIKMVVDTNHMKIQVRDPNMIIMHYDVDLKLVSEKDESLKDCPKKYLIKSMMAFGKLAWPGRFPAFDGKKNLFSKGDLPIGDGPYSDFVHVENHERRLESGQPEQAKVKVTVKKVNVVSLTDIGNYFQNRERVRHPSLAVQALDIALRNAGSTRLMPVGRNFFTPPQGRPISLGNGMELWFGVFQSAILSRNGLFFNVDVAHKGFPKAQSVSDLVVELGTPPPRFNQAPPPPFDVYNWDVNDRYNYRLLETFKNFIKGLKVEYEVPRIANSKRVYRVVDVVKPASDQMFSIDLPNGGKQQSSVAQYYQNQKGIKLQCPHWPCLHVGSKDRQIYVPMELCRIAPNQVTIKKLDDEQTRNMVKNAATKPDVRRRKIMDAFSSLKLNQDPCLNEFGIRVNDTMQEVEGRVLTAPSLEYQGGKEVRVKDGVWRADRMHFLRPGKSINTWAIIDLSNCEKGRQEIANSMQRGGAEVGVQFLSKPSIFFPRNRLNSKLDVERYLAELGGAQKNLDLAFVIIPDYIGNVSPYPIVKQVLEMKFNILTQCIKRKTADKLNPATVQNILLKINAKTNGINHSIHGKNRPPCFLRPIMIMGADVTHPPPDAKNCPSVAAVTASHDPSALFQYNMQWRLQPSREEIILDLEEITLEHLRFFAAKVSKSSTVDAPERIIFYRDGVSDGQFEMVLRVELLAIRRAVKRFKPDYNPMITFLVVQKRHHTRFFPKPRDSMADRNGNVPSGFVVDTVITHPRDIDFYLVSHASIQGTSRPTKYKVLFDESNMGEDELEQLTYYLCHLFSRCNRSVSYPAPTYYAHLAAFRAKHYIEGKQINTNDDKQLKTESLNLNRAMIKFNEKNPMFFV